MIFTFVCRLGERQRLRVKALRKSLPTHGWKEVPYCNHEAPVWGHCLPNNATADWEHGDMDMCSPEVKC